jgi:hypothetical protein
MLAASSVTNAGIHGDGYAEAGLPAPGGGRTRQGQHSKGFRIMELLFQHT